MATLSTKFTFRFLHQYFTNGQCRDLHIAPTVATVGALANQSLLHRFVNGHMIELIAAAGFTGSISEPLQFWAKPNQPNFWHYTDLPVQNGQLLWLQCTGNQVQCQTINLVGPLFQYTYTSAKTNLQLSIQNQQGNTIYQSTGTYNGRVYNYKPDLTNYPPGRYTVKVIDQNKTLKKETVYVDRALQAQGALFLVELPLQPLPAPAEASHTFDAKKESWRFYFISKTETDNILLLKDETTTPNGNRYTHLPFHFCERPVERAIDGTQVCCFETGHLDDNDKFVPQLIPAYEESKNSLALYQFEKAGQQHKHKADAKSKYKYRKRGRRDDDDDDDDGNDGHNDQADYFHYKCLDRLLWHRRLRRHATAKVKKLYCSYKLKKRGRKLITHVQNPSLKNAQKEVYIYI